MSDQTRIPTHIQDSVLFIFPMQEFRRGPGRATQSGPD